MKCHIEIQGRAGAGITWVKVASFKNEADALGCYDYFKDLYGHCRIKYDYDYV